MTKVKKRATQSSGSGVSPTLIILVIVAAVLVVGGLILLNNPANTQVNVSGFPALGAENAPVVIVEYSDYGCSHCRDFALDKFPLLDVEYIQTGKLRFIVHPFYLGNPDMGRAVEAAWCAQDQGKFFEYRHALFEKQGMAMSPENLASLAGEVGLDIETFAQCLANGTHRTDVQQATQAAVSRGINSTPTFFINNRRVRGNEPYEVFQRLIEQELARAP